MAGTGAAPALAGPGLTPRPRGPRLAALAAILALACSGQRGKEPERAGLGRAVFSGPVRALKASADGAWLAVLGGCREVRGQFLPPRTASCDLRVVPAAGGEARRVAGAVTTLPQGVLWSPEGATLAALAEYDYPAASGALVVVRGGGAPRTVAEGVTFHGFLPGAPDALAAVAGGRLLVVRGGGAPAPLAGVEAAGSFDAGPAGAARAGEVELLLRRSAASGGGLLAVAADGRARPVAERTGDYALAPGGAAFAYTVQEGSGYTLRLVAGGRTVELGRDVGPFAFSRDGSAIAFVADAKPGKQGDLRVVEVAAAGRRPAALLAREVGEFRWATRAPRLSWLERYDARVRAGTAGAGGPGAPARSFASGVSDLQISPDGAHLAFLQHTTRGGYSVDLGLARLDGPAEAPLQSVAQGVFGFSFSPDGRWLYYRTRCTRNAEACDLERVPAGGLAPGAKPEAIAQGAKSFEFDPRDPERLLVTWQRMDRDALDVAVFEEGKLTTVDTYVLPGSAQFLGPDSRRVAYAVIQEKRQGAYVAELP